MTSDDNFDLKHFLPYLLNQAAEQSSLDFQRYYKSRYGMLRTEWRVLFHLGRYGEMTATTICHRAKVHKTKVSRAVAALEDKKFLSRQVKASDRRNEILSLTSKGRKAFDDLCGEAQRFDQEIVATMSAEEASILRASLARIAQL